MSARATSSEGRSRAFTLIEVLVVVAIIALLVSILLPSLNRARWQAKLVACRGNLHGLGGAFLMYAEMSRNHYPYVPDSSTDSFCALWRARQLANPGMVICPATRNVVRPGTIRFAGDPATETKSDLYYVAGNKPGGEGGGPTDSQGGHSYEYNGCFNTDKPYPLSGAHKRTNILIFPPHQMFLVHDADNDFNGSAGCRPVVLSEKGESGNNCPQPWDNHGETGMNMMFADAHAQFVRKKSGTVVDWRKASNGNIPPAARSANAEIEKIWLQSQYPWRLRGGK